MRRNPFPHRVHLSIAAAPALLACLALGLVAPGAATAASLDGIPSFGHVFLIVGENTSIKQVTPKHAPYITGTLIPHGAWLTHYSGLTDGSLGDYAAMVSGQFVRCERNNDFSFTSGDVPGQVACHQNVNNLFHQLDSRSVSWQEWTESATQPCDMFDHGSTWAGNLFVSHHSPALYFDDIQAHHSSEDVIPSPECRQKVLPAGGNAPKDMGIFDDALQTGNVGRFDMVIPNDCENGHDTCGTNDSVRPVRRIRRPRGPQDPSLARVRDRRADHRRLGRGLRHRPPARRNGADRTARHAREHAGHPTHPLQPAAHPRGRIRYPATPGPCSPGEGDHRRLAVAAVARIRLARVAHAPVSAI